MYGGRYTCQAVSMVEVSFSTRDDGQVDAWIGPGRPALQEALHDSISSLPPRGALHNGPSTYWIDHAERGAHRALETADERPFAYGNSTVLILRRDQVEGRYIYSEPDEAGDVMPVGDFFTLLAKWRERVEETAAKSTTQLSETYRRNPVP
jgi:hypothetical protein